MIDCLNNVATFDCNPWNTDIDRNELPTSTDMLRVVDLLNGAGVYNPWLGVGLPANPCMSGSSNSSMAEGSDLQILETATTGGGTVDETAQVEGEATVDPVVTVIEDEPDCWTWEERALTLEVQRVGGGGALSVLAPNTTYELHYKAESAGVLFYVLSAVGILPDVSLAAVTPASSGPWADTGNFSAYDLIDTDEGPVPASDYPDGYYYYHLALDEALGSSEGQMCTFTTGQVGELRLHVYMDTGIDLAGSPCVQLITMEAQASYPVE